MRPIKVGVIGTGRMGQHHCRVYSSLRQVQFIGVYDQNLQAAEANARRYDIQAFPSADELLKRVTAVTLVLDLTGRFPEAIHAWG